MRDIRSYDLKSVDVHSPDWFLNLDGKRIGPYPLDALFGLASDGEIGTDQKITSKHIDDQWASLLEIKAAMLAPPKVTAPPPERPSNIDNLVNPSPASGEQREDATDSLFNALQKSKELQAKKRETNERDLQEERPFDSSLIQAPTKKKGPPKQLFLIGLFGFVFGVSIWAIFQIMNKKEGVTSTSSSHTETKKITSGSNSQSQNTSHKPPLTTGGFSNRPARPNTPGFSGRDENEPQRDADVPPQPPQEADPADLERERQEREREREQMLKDAQQYQNPGGGAQPISPALPMNEAPAIMPGNPDPNAPPYGSGHNPSVLGAPPPGDIPLQQ